MTNAITLGERMKGYENDTDLSYFGASWLMRLDGASFSKLMKKIGAVKPFDPRIMEMMTAVSTALLARFNFVTVYTQSDEITCIPNLIQDQQIEADNMFNLRLQKLCSVVASYASVVFYREMLKFFPEYADTVTPVFDARFIVVPNLEEVVNCLIWRQRDCIKNAKNLVGQQFFSPKELNKLTSDEQIAKVQSEKGVSFDSYPAEFRNGILVKRVLVTLTGLDPDGRVVEYTRGRPTVFTKVISPESLDWVLAKYVEKK